MLLFLIFWFFFFKLSRLSKREQVTFLPWRNFCSREAHGNHHLMRRMLPPYWRFLQMCKSCIIVETASQNLCKYWKWLGNQWSLFAPSLKVMNDSMKIISAILKNVPYFKEWHDFALNYTVLCVFFLISGKWQAYDFCCSWNSNMKKTQNIGPSKSVQSTLVGSRSKGFLANCLERPRVEAGTLSQKGTHSYTHLQHLS